MTPTEPGIGAALGALAATLAEPFTSPQSRTFLPFLAISAVVALVVQGGPPARALGLHLWRNPSALLDLQLLLARQLMGLLGWLPRAGSAAALAIGLVRLLDASLGRPELPTPPPLLLHAISSVLFFIAWDLSRYLLHRLMHRSALLWPFHAVHHGAEVLTPLSFHRVHPVEALLYELRGTLVTGTLAGLGYWLFRGEALPITILGMDAIGVVLNGIFGNLRHSHVWLRFSPALEGWLLSPAQHQIHHSSEGTQQNLGVWLACWDRLGGSLARSGPTPPARLGLPDAPQELGRALLAPFAQALRGAGA